MRDRDGNRRKSRRPKRRLIGPPDDRQHIDARVLKCRCGKVAYEAEEDALLAGSVLGLRFDVYPCGEGWHVTTL